MLHYNLVSMVRVFLLATIIALSHCHPGCAMIIARSFARIHETNLKVGSRSVSNCERHSHGYIYLQKQGVLPVWFAEKSDYSRINSGDIVETIGLAGLLRGDQDAKIKVKVTRRSGEVIEIPLKHTMSSDQLKWLQAGSALNYIRSQMM
jgi:homoaconitase